MSATRPCTSGSSGASSARMRPSRSASSQSCRAHPVVAGGRRVALVEDEVDDLEHRREPRRRAPRRAAPRSGTCALGSVRLGAHDALRDGRLGHKKGPRDLLGRQAAEQPQREGDARLGGENRMTGDEHQAQQIVADVVVERGVEIGRGALLLRPRARSPSSSCLRSSACCGGSRSMARCLAVAMSQAPGLSGTPDSGHCSSAATQRILRQVLGQADIAHHPGEAGDEPRRLDPPDRVDGAMGVGSRHGYRSHHLARRASSARRSTERVTRRCPRHRSARYAFRRIAPRLPCARVSLAGGLLG